MMVFTEGTKPSELFYYYIYNLFLYYVSKIIILFHPEFLKW